ncbi:MAG: RluA family pseudouridine synthase [Candidatus Marinamargulisbacteria bacterium]
MISFSVFILVTQRLDRYLAITLGIPRERLKVLIQTGAIQVNNARVRPSLKVVNRDHIKVVLPKVERTEPLPILEHSHDLLKTQQFKIDILHHDDDVIIVNKPAGLLVHDVAGDDQDSLVAILLRAGIQLYLSDNIRPGIVHRLDQFTEGVLVLVKSKVAYDSLKEQFKDRSVQKSYFAILKGVPVAPEGVIDRPIGRDRAIRARKSCHHYISGSEKDAITNYRVVQATTNTCLVDIDLITGRTHQIRVHFAALQCPVLGDALYSSQSQRDDGYLLQSYRLGFKHPSSGDPVLITVPLSNRLKQYAQR